MDNRDPVGAKVALATRVANLVMFTLVFICALVFMITQPDYLAIVISIYTMIFALILVTLELQKVPFWMMACFRSEAGFVLHPRGRIGFIFAVALLMFGEGTFGAVLGVGLIALVAVNAYVLYKFPEDFSANYVDLGSGIGSDSYASSSNEGNFAAPPPRTTQSEAAADGTGFYGANSSSDDSPKDDESSSAMPVAISDI